MDIASANDASPPIAPAHPARQSILYGGAIGIAAGIGTSIVCIVLAMTFDVAPTGRDPSPLSALFAAISLIVGGVPAALLAGRYLKNRNIHALPPDRAIASAHLAACRTLLIVSFLIGYLLAAFLPATIIIALTSLL